MTGIRQKVKSGELTVDAVLNDLKTRRRAGEFVGDSIIHWLERRKGIRVAALVPRKNKNKRQRKGGHPAG